MSAQPSTTAHRTYTPSSGRLPRPRTVISEDQKIEMIAVYLTATVTTFEYADLNALLRDKHLAQGVIHELFDNLGIDFTAELFDRGVQMARDLTD